MVDQQALRAGNYVEATFPAQSARIFLKMPLSISVVLSHVPAVRNLGSACSGQLNGAGAYDIVQWHNSKFCRAENSV